MVNENEVTFLSRSCTGARDDQFDICQASCFAAAAAKKGETGEAKLAGAVQGEKNVWGIAAGREDDHQVTLGRQSLDLPGEDLIEAVVVADAAQQGAVRRESNCRQRTPVFAITPRKFRGKVRRLGGAAPVTADQQFVPAPQGLEDQIGRAIDLWLKAFKLLQDADRFVDFF